MEAKKKSINATIAVSINSAVEFYAAYLTIARVFGQGLTILQISDSAVVDGFILVRVEIEDGCCALYHLGDKKCFYERFPTVLNTFLESEI